jgi:hypothetical protein
MPHPDSRRRFPRASLLGFGLAGLGLLPGAFNGATGARAQTARGELEARPAPVNLRRCLGGSNAGALCNRDAACPGSSCRARNVFNISAALYFNASAAEVTAVRNALTAGSAWLFDVTDGQAEFGRVTLINNAPAGTSADIRILPASNSTWWNANTGNWRVGGSVNVSIDNVLAAATPGPIVAHEFVHLAFDPRDEYESRAAGCGAVTGGDSCPSGATGAASCLMDGNGSELCTGQAVGSAVAGNDHDSDNSTEQSRCRANRSCWDQVVWSYPNTFLKPAGAPDPAANGAIATPPVFTVLSGPARVVLVLDQSGSMALEAPNRLSRLQLAAKDFVTLAPAGTEIGLVSFASDVVAERTIAAVGADRSTWTAFIDGLSPTSRTNIGAALQRARSQISTAGGPTGTTFVVLMTDGLNNEPAPSVSAQASLDGAVAALLADGVPVHVTCTGADLGLQSQCSEIALGSSGTYVDSATASSLPLSFVEIAARGLGFERIGEWSKARRAAIARLKAQPSSPLGQWIGGTLGTGDAAQFFVEKEARQALFTAQWPAADQKDPGAVLVAPDGRLLPMTPMPQGLYAFVAKPMAGIWRIRLARELADPTFRAYAENPSASVAIGVRYATVAPGQPITFFAYPRAGAKALAHPQGRLEALLTRPDGRQDRLIFSDRGRQDNDDVADDGVFTAVYPRTDLRGAYALTAWWPVQQWRRALDAVGHTHHEEPLKPSGHLHGHGRSRVPEAVEAYRSPSYLREVTATATVLVKGKDIDRKPDDPAPQR